jgi:hypothetical protein
MGNTRVPIKRCYAFTFEGGPGGHISLTNDGRAILVHSCNPKSHIEFEVFANNPDETAEAQAKRHVWENIDENAEFFDDPFLDLANWLLQM